MWIPYALMDSVCFDVDSVRFDVDSVWPDMDSAWFDVDSVWLDMDPAWFDMDSVWHGIDSLWFHMGPFRVETTIIISFNAFGRLPILRPGSENQFLIAIRSIP